MVQLSFRASLVVVPCENNNPLSPPPPSPLPLLYDTDGITDARDNAASTYLLFFLARARLKLKTITRDRRVLRARAIHRTSRHDEIILG